MHILLSAVLYLACVVLAVLTSGLGSISLQLSTRQSIGTCAFTRIVNKVEKVGDGNPRSWMLHKQLSEKLDCPYANGCTGGASLVKSYDIGFTSAPRGGSITGDFDVSTSRSTGSGYTCSWRKGESGCIVYNMAHTEYDVKEYTEYIGCARPAVTEPRYYTIRAPNNRNPADGISCTRDNACKAQGYQWWEGV